MITGRDLNVCISTARALSRVEGKITVPHSHKISLLRAGPRGLGAGAANTCLSLFYAYLSAMKAGPPV